MPRNWQACHFNIKERQWCPHLCFHLFCADQEVCYESLKLKSTLWGLRIKCTLMYSMYCEKRSLPIFWVVFAWISITLLKKKQKPFVSACVLCSECRHMGHDFFLFLPSLFDFLFATYIQCRQSQVIICHPFFFLIQVFFMPLVFTSSNQTRII